MQPGGNHASQDIPAHIPGQTRRGPHRAGEQRNGTGDIFSSIVIADAVNGVAFERSVRRASSFVKKCILRSMELGIPTTDGVCFEEVLGELRRETGERQ